MVGLKANSLVKSLQRLFEAPFCEMIVSIIQPCLTAFQQCIAESNNILISLGAIFCNRDQDGLLDVCWELWIIVTRRGRFHFGVVIPVCLLRSIGDVEQSAPCD